MKELGDTWASVHAGTSLYTGISALWALLIFTLLPGILSAQDYQVSGINFFEQEEVARLTNGLRLDSAVLSLHTAYTAEGFLDVEVQGEGETEIHVTEGERFVILEFIVLPDTALQRLLAVGFNPAEVNDVYATEENISGLLNEAVAILNVSGYPLASATIAKLGIRDSLASVVLHAEILPGDLVTINEIEVQGNEETSRDLILDAAGIPPDVPFTDQLARQVRSRLERLNFFSAIEEPQIYRTDSGTYGLLLTVTEGSANTFDGVVGYQPATELEENGFFTGFVHIILRNLFGGGERISGRWEKRTRTTLELELRYGQPFLFGLPLDLDVMFLQRQEEETSQLTSYVQRSFTGDFYYGITDDWYIRLGGALDQTIPEADSVDPCSPRQLLNSTLLSTTIGILYDTRSNRYNPVSGVSYSTSLSVGNKSINDPGSCLDPLIPRSESRQRIEVDLETFLPIAGPVVLANGLHYGEIRGDFLEESDLFRFGGHQTVRGYRENLIRASRRTWGTVEGRILLSRLSHAALFFDGGYYNRAPDRIRDLPEIEEWIYGYGVGLQIDTPLGLATFSFALGKGDTFETGKVFVGLVNQF